MEEVSGKKVFRCGFTYCGFSGTGFI